MATNLDQIGRFAQDVEPLPGKPHDFWLNVYRLSDGTLLLYQHRTKRIADENAMPKRCACLCLTFAEGDGL